MFLSESWARSSGQEQYRLAAQQDRLKAAQRNADAKEAGACQDQVIMVGSVEELVSFEERYFATAGRALTSNKEIWKAAQVLIVLKDKYRQVLYWPELVLPQLCPQVNMKHTLAKGDLEERHHHETMRQDRASPKKQFLIGGASAACGPLHASITGQVTRSSTTSGWICTTQGRVLERSARQLTKLAFIWGFPEISVPFSGIFWGLYSTWGILLAV